MLFELTNLDSWFCVMDFFQNKKVFFELSGLCVFSIYVVEGLVVYRSRIINVNDVNESVLWTHAMILRVRLTLISAWTSTV